MNQSSKEDNKIHKATGYIDGDYVVSLYCPTCGKTSREHAQADEGETITLDCGHVFKAGRIVSYIELIEIKET